MYTLERLITFAIDNYPKLSKRYNLLISLAIVRLFIAVQFRRGVSLYNEFVARVVYQSLVRTFSYKTTYAVRQDDSYGSSMRFVDEYADEQSSDSSMSPTQRNIYNITSNDYLPFWSTMLNLTEFKELNVHVSKRRKLLAIIYNEYIESCLKIMKKLDLSTVRAAGSPEEQEQQRQVGQSESVSSNPVLDLRATRPRDFEILVNLVDFSR
jgi:hypothetical protein